MKQCDMHLPFDTIGDNMLQRRRTVHRTAQTALKRRTENPPMGAAGWAESKPFCTNI